MKHFKGYAPKKWLTFDIDSIVLSVGIPCSSNKQGATKLNPRNSSWAVALGGRPGESERREIYHKPGKNGKLKLIKYS